MSTKATTKQRKLELPSAKKRPFKKKGAPIKDSLPKETTRKDLVDSESFGILYKFSQYERTLYNFLMLDVLTQKHLDLLKLFDHNRDFGPCIGKHVFHVCLVQ